MKQFLYIIGFISYGMIAQNNVCFEIQNYSNPNEPALSYFTKYVNVLDCFDIFAESGISDAKILHAAAVAAELLDNNEDANNNGNSPSSEDASGGFATIAIAGIIAFIVIIGGLGVFLFTRRSSNLVPVENMSAVNTSSTNSTTQQGEMIPTDRNCVKCGAPGLVFIPAYQRHFCRTCSQYE